MGGKDSARSWLVLVVVTYSIFMEIGIIKAFSVLLPDLKEQMVTQTWIVGSSIAIITAFGYLLGLISGSLVQFFSPRVCVMASGLIASLGFIVCSLATSPSTLLIGLLLTGFVLLQENILIGVVPEHFDKYFEVAVGIYSAGTAFGIVIFPIITQMLLDVYGWRGTLLILSGLLLHSVPCGAFIPSQKIGHFKIHRNHVYYELFDPKDDNDSQEKSEERHLLRNAFQKLSDGLDFSLLTKFSFINNVLILGFVNGYILTGWMIYTVSFALSLDLSIREGSIIAANGGIGLGIARLGIPLCHKFMSYKQVLYVTCAITAISLSLTTFYVSFLALKILAVVFGMGMGCLGTEMYISAKENCEESEHYHAVACVHLLYGTRSILSGLITGLCYDATGSFTISYHILAAIALVPIVSLGITDLREAKNKKCSLLPNYL